VFFNIVDEVRTLRPFSPPEDLLKHLCVRAINKTTPTKCLRWVWGRKQPHIKMISFSRQTLMKTAKHF
jgi:hypothetical protein